LDNFLVFWLATSPKAIESGKINCELADAISATSLYQQEQQPQSRHRSNLMTESWEIYLWSFII
jgi:hypothetical protein